MLKKDFFGDPKVGTLSPGCRLLFQSLWVHADDTGHGIADPRLLKSQCFPYDADITADQVQQWMDVMSGAAMVRQYEVEGQKYYLVVNFAKHQIINRPSHFAFPKPSLCTAREDSVSTPTRITDESRNAPLALTDERERRKKKGKRTKDCAGAHDFQNPKIDPRFDPLVKAFAGEFEKTNPGLRVPFDGGDGKALNLLLKRQSDVPIETLFQWMQNAFASQGVPPLHQGFRMREFAGHAEKFAHGPLRRFGTLAPQAVPQATREEAANFARIVGGEK
jgi:hypothetical protein